MYYIRVVCVCVFSFTKLLLSWEIRKYTRRHHDKVVFSIPIDVREGGLFIWHHRRRRPNVNFFVRAHFVLRQNTTKKHRYVLFFSLLFWQPSSSHTQLPVDGHPVCICERCERQPTRLYTVSLSPNSSVASRH